MVNVFSSTAESALVTQSAGAIQWLVNKVSGITSPFLSRESAVVESDIEKVAREVALRPAVVASKGSQASIWTFGALVITLGFLAARYWCNLKDEVSMSLVIL